jgi:arabinan endo-1,5-alpha-L-arabinosidase
MLRCDDIRIRDPFVLPVPGESRYYLYGTTDPEPWREDQAVGFDAYRSADLVHWEGPFPVFRPAPDFWGKFQFWAPEVHPWRDRFAMFASFKGSGRHRGTQVLLSASPLGPFTPLGEGAATPPDWECLDGTLFTEADGKPWMIFSRDWTQATVGAYAAMPLADDLSAAVGPAFELFRVNAAPWVLTPPWHFAGIARGEPPCFVADGAFPFRTRAGGLALLFSSWGARGYATGIARSKGGTLRGPWNFDPQPLFSRNGGHAMVFIDFEGRRRLALHQPNDPPPEHPRFLPFEE